MSIDAPQEGWGPPEVARDTYFVRAGQSLWERATHHCIEMVGRRDGKNQLGQLVYRNPGDHNSRVFVKQRPTERDHGMWAWAWPMIASGDPGIVLTEGGSVGSGGATVGRTDALPVRYDTWAADARFELLDVATDPYRALPKGTRMLVVDATHEPEQQPLGFEVCGPLIPQWRGADVNAYSSVLADIDDAGAIDPTTITRLDSMMRIARPLSGVTFGDLVVEGDVGGNALAWNCTGNVEGVGFGLAWFDEVHARMSWEAGGPLHPGHPTSDRHRIGTDSEGHATNAGHLWTGALFYMDVVRDGRMRFELPPWEPGFSTPYVAEVSLRFDFVAKEWAWQSYDWFQQPTQGGDLEPVQGIATHCEVGVPGIVLQPQRTWRDGEDLRHTANPDAEALEVWRQTPAVVNLEAGGAWGNVHPNYSTEPGERRTTGTAPGFVGVTPPEWSVGDYRQGHSRSTAATSSASGVAMFGTALWFAKDWDVATGDPRSGVKLSHDSNTNGLILAGVDSSGDTDKTVPARMCVTPQLEGGLVMQATEVDDHVTLDASHLAVEADTDTKGAQINVTLPSGASHAGQVYALSNVGSSGFNAQYQRTGSDTIDGATTLNVPDGATIAVRSDGKSPTNWIPIWQYA